MNSKNKVKPTLFDELELFLGADDDGLQHFVRRDVRPERPRVPELSDELSESLRQQRQFVAGRPLYRLVILLAQEVVAQRRDVGKGLEG